MIDTPYNNCHQVGRGAKADDEDPPKLIVEVRSGCLDPDDICTVVTSGHGGSSL